MQHGGDLTTAMALHGGAREDWLDLSTGINPFPWPVPALPLEAWTALPSRAALDRLLAVARQAYRIPEGADLVAAPGTQSLIQWLPHLAPAGGVAILGPTYSEHALSWTRAGRRVVSIAEPAEFVALPADVRHLVAVQPNNPDGRWLARADLKAATEQVVERGGWLVLDESFADLRPEATAAALCASAPLIVLRSFGKFYGLAGLRLGFAVAPPLVAGLIAAALGPWSVGGPALAIGAAALSDEAWAASMRHRLAAEAEALDVVLAGAGLSPVGGTDLYRLVCHAEARAIHSALAGERIWVRRFDWDATLLRFGLPPDGEGRERLRRALAKASG